MIPESVATNLIISDDSIIEPSLTYKLDFANKRIMGKVDNSAALLQAIKKILLIDKYAYVIYDWYHGNEINLLIGQSFSYVTSELPRIVEEALIQDDRILGIADIVITPKTLDSIEVSFTVITIFGNILYGMEVNI